MSDAAVTVHRERGIRPGRFARALAPYTAFAPAIVLLGGFFLVPLGIIVLYSFWEVIDYNVVHHWTLDNYRYFFSVSTYISTMWATIWVSVAATAATIAIAFPFTYWLVRYVPRGLQRLTIANPTLRQATILDRKGLVSRFLEWSGITSHPTSALLYNRPAIVLVLVYLYFPFAALTLYSSIERFDWDQLRAARDLGATPLGAIRRILIPQVRPGIVTAVIFVFIPILGEYLTPQIVGGASVPMIGNLVFNFFQNAEYTRGAAVSLLIALFILLLLFVFRRSLSTREAYGG